MYLSFLAVIVQPLTGITHSRSAHIVVVPTIDKANFTVTDDPFILASSSTKSFLGALAVNGIILAAKITAFTYLRHKFRDIYEPRSSSFCEACAFRRLLPWDVLILV